MKKIVFSMCLLLLGLIIGCSQGFDSDGNDIDDSKEVLVPTSIEALQQIVDYYFFTKPNSDMANIPNDEKVTPEMVEKRKAAFPDLIINTENIRDMSFLFSLMEDGAENLFNGPVESWDTKNVTNMQGAFLGAQQFNRNIGSWNTSNVTNMSGTFAGATSFDQDISSWDVSNVVDMRMMFTEAESFNQPVKSWNTRNVVNMGNMFLGAISFNQDISDWDISSVVDMGYMFAGALNFDQDLSSWNVIGKLTDNMFLSTPMENKLDWHPEGCACGVGSHMIEFDANNNGIDDSYESFTFDHKKALENFIKYYFFTSDGRQKRKSEFFNTLDINTQHITDMGGLFDVDSYHSSFLSNYTGGNPFNGDISHWDVGNVGNMDSLFSGAEYFNQDISDWDVSNVTNMKNMFDHAIVFNQDISSWDVSSATTMEMMFDFASSFNQDISSWDVSRVTSMKNMFRGATSFNQDLSSWDATRINTENMFLTTPMEDRYEWHPQGCNCGAELDGDKNGFDDRREASVVLKDSAGFKNFINYYVFPSEYRVSVDERLKRAEAFDIITLDTSNVRDMSRLLYSSSSLHDFNSDVSDWDVSNVVNMREMFVRADLFNQDISSWDVGNVTSMKGMFTYASNFNQDISGWDISNVTDMQNMFKGAKSFYQDLSSWDVTEISTGDMFLDTPMQDKYEWHPKGCRCGMELDGNKNIIDDRLEGSFIMRDREDLKNFIDYYVFPSSYSLGIKEREQRLEVLNTFALDTQLVWDMRSIFEAPRVGTENRFNNDISDWNVSGATTMKRMFAGAKIFNQDISSWDVSNTTNMDNMFVGADAFNQYIGNWDVGNVTNMSGMFKSADAFNQYIGNWDVLRVIDMSNMFEGARFFNQDISSWDIRNVSDMSYMFNGATSFYQDLSSWDAKGKRTQSMFDGTPMQQKGEWHPMRCRCWSAGHY